MCKYSNVKTWVIMTVLGVCFSGAIGQEKHNPHRDYTILSLRKIPDAISDYVSGILLPQKEIAFSWSGTLVSGELTVEEYECVYEEKEENGAVSRDHRRLTCFTLRSRNKKVPFVYPLWVRRPVREIRAFPRREGGAYVAWLALGGTYYEIAMASRTRKAALLDYFLDRQREPAQRHRHHVPVVSLIGDRPFLGMDAIFSEIEILDLRQEETGQLRLKVGGLATGDVFELTREAEQQGSWSWRKLDEEGRKWVVKRVPFIRRPLFLRQRKQIDQCLTTLKKTRGRNSPLMARQRCQTIANLAKIGHETLLPVLRDIATDVKEPPKNRAIAIRGIGNMGEKSAISTLVELLDSSDPEIFGVANQCLNAIFPEAVTDLFKVVSTPESSAKQDTPATYRARVRRYWHAWWEAHRETYQPVRALLEIRVCERPQEAKP